MSQDKPAGLRTIRESQRPKLSRERLARLADVSTSTVQMIEGGWRCSEPTAEKIAAALGVTPADLWAAEANASS